MDHWQLWFCVCIEKLIIGCVFLVEYVTLYSKKGCFLLPKCLLLHNEWVPSKPLLFMVSIYSYLNLSEYESMQPFTAKLDRLNL